MQESVPFRILTVCTGNICRSPMAERLLQTGLDARFPGQFVVASAGTGALVGNPVDPTVAGFIRVLGGHAEHFSARQLTPAILEGQDLVLALTRDHRSQVVGMSPSMLRKTFTLREFARIIPDLHRDDSVTGSERWRRSLPQALRARSSRPWKTEDDDVIDPYRRDQQKYIQMMRELQQPIQTIISF